MGLRPKKPSRRATSKLWRMSMRLDVAHEDASKAWTERMLALADDDAFDLLLRRAASETLLDAYRRRFAAAIPTIVNTERLPHAANPRQPKKAVTEALIAASERLSRANESGNLSEIDRARLSLRDARRAMSAGLQRPDPKGGRLGPGNVYRPAVYKLMNVLTSAGYMGLRKGGVGIGPRKKIESMRTPSATKHYDQIDTTSDMTSLFRQVEFGTGVHGIDPEGNSGSPFSFSGGWYYGKTEHQGVVLGGAKPARVLWDKARAPYSEDYTRLQQFLHSALGSSLK